MAAWHVIEGGPAHCSDGHPRGIPLPCRCFTEPDRPTYTDGLDCLSEIHLPILAHEVATEASMGLCPDQAKSSVAVDQAGRGQDALRP